MEGKNRSKRQEFLEARSKRQKARSKRQEVRRNVARLIETV
jgi:hypothetical protein